MPLYPLTNFAKQKYYQNEPKFNSVYTGNYLLKIKDEEYIISLDKYESIGTHWIAQYVNAKNVTCFDIFGVKFIPNKKKEIDKKGNSIRSKNIIKNIYRIRAYNSKMCGYFCIGFIDFMLEG